MQFIKCTREALLKPLQTVGGIVEGRQTLPILANVLIQKEKDKVSFTTTDLEIQIRTTADVGTGDEDCKTSLPAAKLLALLAALPGASTEVALNAEERKVVLSAANSRFSLSQLPAGRSLSGDFTAQQRRHCRANRREAGCLFRQSGCLWGV